MSQFALSSGSVKLANPSMQPTPPCKPYATPNDAGTKGTSGDDETPLMWSALPINGILSAEQNLGDRRLGRTVVRKRCFRGESGFFFLFFPLFSPGRLGEMNLIRGQHLTSSKMPRPKKPRPKKTSPKKFASRLLPEMRSIAGHSKKVCRRLVRFPTNQRTERIRLPENPSGNHPQPIHAAVKSAAF